MTLHHNVKVTYSKSIQDILRRKQHHQLLNCESYFWKHNTWLIFCSDNATTISEASCRTFHYEKFLVETNPHYLAW